MNTQAINHYGVFSPPGSIDTYGTKRWGRSAVIQPGNGYLRWPFFWSTEMLGNLLHTHYAYSLATFTFATNGH